MTETQIAELRDQASETMAGYGQALADRVEKTQQKIGRKVEDAANAVYDHAHIATDAGRSVAARLSTTGSYLRDRTAQDMIRDAQVAMVRNPTAAVIIGVAAGFLIGRVVGRSRA